MSEMNEGGREKKDSDEVDFVPVTKNGRDANHNNIYKKPLYGDCDNSKKTGLTTLEKFSFFTLSRKSGKPEPRHRKHSFVKSASFSRILGNTYNTKKYENELRKYQDQVKTKQVNFKERFHQTDNPVNQPVCLADFQETHSSHGTKALRTISRGFGKLWWKRSHSVEISSPDPEYKVSYLGNVLTGWAKGKSNSLSYGSIVSRALFRFFGLLLAFC